LIQENLQTAKTYLNEWLQYQSLWDLNQDHLYNVLKEDLNSWNQLVIDLKQARTTFDTAEVKAQFGALTIDYEQVQMKVNSKYDAWQRDIVKQFGSILLSNMQQHLTLLRQSRNELENQQDLKVSDLVAFIVLVRRFQTLILEWKDRLDLLKNSQRNLEKQRYQFPNEWIYIDQLEGEFSALNELIQKKSNYLNENKGNSIHH
jgi:dynein heavy chain 1